MCLNNFQRSRSLRYLDSRAVTKPVEPFGFPLRILQGLQGSSEARTWLLPLMRHNVKHAPLHYWKRHMLPLAGRLGGQGARLLEQQGQQARVLGLKCRALEAQLWLLLPAFCTQARDVASGYRWLHTSVLPSGGWVW